MQLTEIWRYPVKALRGERLDHAAVALDGVEGDRRVRVMNGRKRITERSVPRLLGLQGSVGPDGEPTIDGVRWDEPRALETIRALVGSDAALRAEDDINRFDAFPIHLVTDGAVEAFGENYRRFRANLVVTGVDGLGERDWVGKRLRIGSTEFVVRESTERCKTTTIDPDTIEIDPGVLIRMREDFQALMGVYCEVAHPGEIAEGDAVELI